MLFRIEQSLSLPDNKLPSNPNSPLANRANKAFYKLVPRRQKNDPSSSESTDPLLLSYNKSYEGEAIPGESEDVFETMQVDKKKKPKKKSFLKKVSKLGRAQSNPVDCKTRSSDSDDKIQTSLTTENLSLAATWPNKPSSGSRTAAKSMDDLSSIPETNTNNNNTTECSPPLHSSPYKLWGFGKKLKEKKSQVTLQTEPEVVIKSAPSTPEKHRKKHSSMPSFNMTGHKKGTVNTSATIVESDHGAVPEHHVKRRLSDATKQERHRSLDQNEMKVLNATVSGVTQINPNVVRASSLNYGDKPNHYAVRYRPQQCSTTSPLGSQPSFLSSSTMDSQDSLNAVSQCYIVITVIINYVYKSIIIIRLEFRR